MVTNPIQSSYLVQSACIISYLTYYHAFHVKTEIKHINLICKISYNAYNMPFHEETKNQAYDFGRVDFDRVWVSPVVEFHKTPKLVHDWYAIRITLIPLLENLPGYQGSYKMRNRNTNQNFHSMIPVSYRKP